MEGKLFDSERKVMEVLWKEGDATAGQLAKRLLEEAGWNRNTTYTVIKKCIAKGAIERREPNFFCKALLTRQQAQRQETQALIGRLFHGSAEEFFTAFLRDEKLSREALARLRQLIDEKEEQ